MTVRKLLLCVLAVCFSLGLAGCELDKDKGGKDKTKGEKEKITFKVYRPNQSGDWLVAEKHEKEVDKNVQPLQVALQTLLEEQPLNGELVNVFPANTKLLDVRVKGDVAEINLSKEILQGEIGGSLNELLVVTSIVNTATEFPEVKKVQLLVEGQKVETIAGHMDILDLLHRDESIIKKN